MSDSGAGGNASTATISLPPAMGVAATDTAAISGALAQAALKGGIVKGQPVLPPPGYVINATLVVPSGVFIEDMVFTPAAGFAGPVLDFQKGGSVLFVNVYEFPAQGWMNGGRRIRIFGNTIPNPAAINAGAIADNRQTADGIWVRDTDHTTLDDVSVDWLAGYAYKFGDAAGQPIREAHLTNLRAFRCGKRTGGPGGNGPAGKPAVWFENAAGPADQDNTLHYGDIRVVYPHWVGVYFDRTGDAAAFGSRLIHFHGGQIEAGGYGGAQDTMQTTGAAFPFDLIYLGNVKTCFFHGTALGTVGQKVINCAGPGAGGKVQLLVLDACEWNDSGAGPGVYADLVSQVRITGCYGFTNTGKTITTTANTGEVVADDTSLLFDTAGNVGVGTVDATAQPASYRGNRITPAMAGNWGPLATAPWQDPFFVKDVSRRVSIEGYVKVTAAGGTVQGDVLFTLPPGYRPANRIIGTSNGFYVEPDGTVRNNLGVQAQNFSAFFQGFSFQAA